MSTQTPVHPSTHTALYSTCYYPSSSRTFKDRQIARSPKRAKSTPSPIDLDSSVGSSTSHRSRHRSSLSKSGSNGRELSFDRQRSSPWIHASGREGSASGQGSLQNKRREMSVPLLSQTLSSFSLSHSPSPPGGPSRVDKVTPNSIPFHIPSPTTTTTSTPRRLPTMLSQTPARGAPRDHTHPSTAPLPSLPAFLGSPFSTTNHRGGYQYKNMSANRMVHTEVLTQSTFSPVGGWLEQSEWMVEDALDGGSPASIEFSRSVDPAPGRLRRDTSGSNSSFDDYSGSASSSTSLHSLTRDSMDLQPESKFNPWNDIKHDFDFDDLEEPETPSRRLFPSSEAMVEDAISGRLRQSPGLSPLLGRSGKTRTAVKAGISPIHTYLQTRTPSAMSPFEKGISPSPLNSQSPFTSITRLLSTRKKSAKKLKITPACSSRSIDTKNSNFTERRTSDVCSISSDTTMRKCTTGDIEQTSGLGISFSSDTSIPEPAIFSRSYSSDSSEEPSPSKPPTVLESSGSATATGTLASPGHNGRTAALARRKTLGTSSRRHTPLIVARQHASMRPNLRRGVTEPQGNVGTSTPGMLSPAHAALATPVSALFGDVKPSPAAFASTGLVKKRSNIPGLKIPKFGDSEPPKPTAKVSPVRPIKSRLGMMTNASDPSRSTDTSASIETGSDGSASVYVRAAQKTRGLRRKTSTMFGASGSNGSIVDHPSPTVSPLTPTRPGGGKSTPFGLGVTTPSPTTPSQMAYPFAPSTSVNAFSSPVRPKFNQHNNVPEQPSPLAGAKTKNHLLGNRPIARSSNPMLSATFRAQADNKQGKLSKHGSRFNTDFSIVQSLGRGEFSQVWKVRERSSGRLFAVKAGKTYTGFKNRLRQLEEVSILRQLSQEPHPNVITFIDSWEHDSRLYIRTALAPCGDLSTFLLSLAERGGMGEVRSWKTLLELSQGLGHIHKHDYAHLDLKPSNILITSEGSLMIADFGLSTVVTPPGAANGYSPALPTAVDGEFVWQDEKGPMTVPSPIVDREVEGDREYLCPEALGDGHVGFEADIFSLGILSLESALNVDLPPNGEGWVKLRNDDFTDLNEHYVLRGETTVTTMEDGVPRVSRQLVDVIKGMMRSEPMLRMTLGDVDRCGPMKMLKVMQRGPALVEESEGFLEKLLG